jgi:ubiquitination network signaling protein AcrB
LTPSVSSSKKRKKQSAQVRTRQPLWAALASTKIVMVKEYELSHAASEFAGSGQLDIHDLGNTPFNTQPEQVWICYVGSDEVCFSTSQFPNAAVENTESSAKSGQPNADESKPFYVKVNGAVWQPTRIVPLQEDGEATDGRRWSGDIYGLTPMSNYECEFVSTRTGEVIFSTSVKTIQARSKEPEVGKPPAQPAAPRPQARRDSPATTLKASIAASEAKNAELKAQLKNLRKENKAKSNAYKRDIDKLTAACQSTGSNDDRYRQKIAQNNTSQKQAEQSILDLDKELKDMETLPEDLVAKQRAAKARYDEEKAAFEGARASFKSFKSSLEAEISAVDNEVSTLQSKRDKFASRIAKLESERERIVDANARGVDEAERKRQDRITLEADIARINRTWQQRITETQARNAQKGAYAASLATAIKSYVDNVAQSNGDVPIGSYDLPGASVPSASPVSYSPWTSPPSAQHGPSLSHSSWSSPAASVPQSLYPPQVSQSHFPNPLFQPQQQHQQPQPFPSFQQQTSQTSYQPPKARGRSSSMLSDVSGFTQGSSPDDENANTVVLPQSASHSQAFQSNPLALNTTNSNTSPLASHPPGLVFGSHAHAPTSPSIRIPPGFAASVGAGRLRQRSDAAGSGSGSNGSNGSGVSGGSGSGSVGSARSSVRSGSGSAGSVKDPTSPI